ncbi:MAG: hypothetical protein ACJZ12_00045 [Candidatus Neomarinimicrobiota bacterium]
MTNRLKILSLGLVVAIVFAVTDYVQRTSQKPRPTIRAKKTTTNAKKRTVRRSKISRQKEIIQDASKKNEPNIVTHGDFLPIPEDIIAMDRWNRNPFMKRPLPEMGSEPEILSNRQLDKEQPRMADFELLKIESVAKLGEKIYVIINGNKYGIGDRIDRYVIEDIYDDRVIFMLGDTRVMKSVGK